MQEKEIYKGLSEAEVAESRAKHGANLLTPPAKEPLWKKFLGKFADPLIRILIVAAVVSIGISFYEFFGHEGAGMEVFLEPIGIIVAILLATGLSFYFEMKADKEFELLNQVNDDEPVQVIRGGNTTEVAKKDIVVGDIIILSTGNEVPADAELLEATAMALNESTLTGEPLCRKTTVKDDFDDEATFPSNHVMRGTTVMEGHGVARVFAVGDKTENGKVFVAAQIDNSVKTPLNEQLDGLAAKITKISYTFAGIIIIARLVAFPWGESFDTMLFLSHMLQTLMVAVTLVVAAVPEGLPMAVTLSLAYSMRRMLKTNNLVRKMHACETMGATTVICTDKTGTLTQNLMQIHETRFFGLPEAQQLASDEMSDIIAEGIAVNSTATLDLTGEKPRALGNPTEGALILWLRAQGVDFMKMRSDAQYISELPFSTERKYMATVVHSSKLNKKVLYVKGAPEYVFALCKQSLGNVMKEALYAMLLNYQNLAMRTLGFAYQVLEDGDATFNDKVVEAKNLTFLGVVAIADPVRSDVPAAVGDCLSAGINVTIVTGDTPGTAREIGRQIGIWNENSTERNLITGPEFAELTDAELEERILDLRIIARARPMDKKRLVETLQRLGQVVAVTGDGTNDAPALKAAHVGLSMGDGTSVAKEASDITIVDNSFASITRAVMWGRSLYRNIQRFILFQMTVTMAACFIVLISALLGMETPLTVTQMLWVNLIMDTFAAMALASLPPSMAVMKDAPRKREDFIIDKAMWANILSVGALFTLLILGFAYLANIYDITSLTQLANLSALTPAETGVTPYERSLMFTLFVMLQFWNMFNARAYLTGASALHFKGCNSFVSIAVVIVLGQIAIVTLGGTMFNVAPLSMNDWLICIFGTSLVLWIGEIFRLFKK